MTNTSRKAMKQKGYKRTKNLRLLEKFIDSGASCTKIEGYPHNSVQSLRASLDNSINRFHTYGILLTVHRGELYLINESKLKTVVYPD